MSLAVEPVASRTRPMAPCEAIDMDAVRRARYSDDPFPHVVGEGVVRAGAIDAIRRDFPDIKEPGFFPIAQVNARGAFADLVAAMESPEFSEAMSDAIRFDLTPFARFTTVRKISEAGAGRIHTDGKSKIATALIYLNDEWGAGQGNSQDNSSGQFRILRGPRDFEDYAAEVPPVMGSLACFLRSENSWHGHKPFVGERRVLQMAWLKSDADAARKSRNHRRSHFLKKLWPFGRGEAM